MQVCEMYPFTYKMCLVFYNEPSEVYAVRNFAFGIFICLTWMLFFYLSSGKFSGNARSRITSKIQHHYVSNAWVSIELFHSSQYILHMVLPGMLGIGFQTSALCEMNIFLLTPLISISKILFLFLKECNPVTCGSVQSWYIQVYFKAIIEVGS